MSNFGHDRTEFSKFYFFVDGFRNLPFSILLFFILSLSSLTASALGSPFSYAGAILALGGCSVLFMGMLIFLVFSPKRPRTFLLYAFVFLLAFLYASFKEKSFPYRYGEETVIRAKVTSEPRARGHTLQYTARLAGVYPLSGESVRAPMQKVLIAIPFPKTVIRRGDVIQVRGIFSPLPYERAEDYAAFLESSGVEALFEGHSKGLRIISRPASHSVIAAANGLRKYVQQLNDRLLPWPHSEFATALFTGNKDGIPRSLVSAFKLSGTMHILAVSGLHFGFITLFFFYFFRLLRLRQVVVYILLIGVVTFYLIFIGDAPSVNRSAIMALCGIAMFLLDRDRDYLNVLAISFNILWIMNPLSIMNPGFLLSFSATFAIIFVVPHISRFLERFMPGFLASSIAVSAGVQIYILPVMLSFFKTFPFVNIAANLPIVPLTGISLALEIIALICYSLFLPLAVIVTEVNAVVITAILKLTLIFSRVPPVAVSGFSKAFIPVYFTAVTVLIIAARNYFNVRGRSMNVI